MACLVQQLFRQKIGQELDQYLIDDVLFSLLRSRRHGPRELLLDIKLTQSCNEYGRSAIVGRAGLPRGHLDWHKNISPFPESSLMRRQRRTDMWGSIDILNELRSLKQPLFGKHKPMEGTLDPGRNAPRPTGVTDPGDEFGGIYILLEEVQPWSCRQEKRLSDLKFMNDYLDDALNTGKCISWGGDRITPGRKILSTHY
jgi:hypothetical protein